MKNFNTFYQYAQGKYLGGERANNRPAEQRFVIL